MKKALLVLLFLIVLYGTWYYLNVYNSYENRRARLVQEILNNTDLKKGIDVPQTYIEEKLNERGYTLYTGGYKPYNEEEVIKKLSEEYGITLTPTE